jgi:hypothetical protein
MFFANKPMLAIIKNNLALSVGTYNYIMFTSLFESIESLVGGTVSGEPLRFCFRMPIMYGFFCFIFFTLRLVKCPCVATGHIVL